MIDRVMANVQMKEKGELAREAARKLSILSSTVKDRALEKMADALLAREDEIITANVADVKAGEEKGLSRALLDRLLLTPGRIADMAEGLRALAALPDPIGDVDRMWTRPNGLQIGKMRVPLGVVGIIYEARPNVTVDAAGLCLKTGNAVILRGGSEAINSNLCIAKILSEAAMEAGVPNGAIQLIESTDRLMVDLMLKANEYLDVLIPRGGAGLIQHVVKNATVPVIETGVGNCHIYVEEDADLEMAADIVVNAKCQRPGVCNAAESLLIHHKVMKEFLELAAPRLLERGVEIRGCPATRAILPQAKVASTEDYAAEFLDLIISVRIVKDIDVAIDHIEKYGTKHSEAIITRDYHKARYFMQRVDAAAVYVNASTRFTDGFQFGFGAEIGISTQKLHARGPMGLNELTTIKYIVFGEGQIRE